MASNKINRNQSVHITVEGVLERMDRDDDMPYPAAIYTRDGEEFFVEVSNKKTKLRKLYDSYVAVTGPLKIVDGDNVVIAKRVIEIEPAGYIQEYDDRIASLDELSDLEGFSHLAEYGPGHDYSKER